MDEWIPGSPHPEAIHVVASAQRGKWEPEAGFRWVDDQARDDLRVEWCPGQPITGYSHVVAALEEGQYAPEPGYDWINPGLDPPDYRVRLVGGEEPPPESAPEPNGDQAEALPERSAETQSSSGAGSRGKVITAEIGIGGMHCERVTENEKALFGNPRDEIYIVVRGTTPAGAYSPPRLPREDDYYEFWSGTHGTEQGWTNKDEQKQSRPSFWKGSLAPGESADFVIHIAEQDNADLGKIKRAVDEILKAISAAASDRNRSDSGSGDSSEATRRAFEQAARTAASLIPEIDSHDYIGTFGANVTNQDGRLVVDWRAIHATEVYEHSSDVGKQMGFPPNFARLKCEGCGSLYWINLFAQEV
jgi:hypothetical protein